MAFKKTVLITILLLTMVLTASGCDLFFPPEETDQPLETGEGLLGQSGPTGKAADDIFTLNITSTRTMNPITSTSDLNLSVAGLVYEPLFEVDETMNVHNKLCTDYEVTNGGLTYMIKVDTDVKFHDGSTFTASDAYYSILLAQQSTKYKERLSIVSGVSPMGNDTLMVTITKENTQLPALLNIPMVKHGSGSDTYPAGSGPYKYNESFTALVKFSEHPDADELPIDTIHLKEFSDTEEMIDAFELGYLDLVVNDATGISNLGYGGATDVRFMHTTSMHYIGFNTGSKIFNNPTARHGMTYIIDRSHIVKDIMDGCASEASLPMNPVSYLYPSSYASNITYDPEKALSILETVMPIFHEEDEDDEQKEDEDKDVPAEDNDENQDDQDENTPPDSSPQPIEEFEKIKFIVNNESAVKLAAARDITRNLEAIGVGIELFEMRYDDYVSALSSGDYDMYYGEVMLTADFDLSPLLTAGGSLNYGRHHDPMCDTAISDYLSASDEDRKTAAEFMLKYISESAPILSIAFERQEVITRRGVVYGMSPTIYNVFNRISDWEININ